MRTIIAGSRTATALDVHRAIRESGFTIATVLSGGARGADAAGKAWAATHDIPIERYPAEWGIHGKAAGPIRNRQMADAADALVAVWDGRSPGTRNMIAEAKKRGLRVHMVIMGSEVAA